MIIQNCTKTLEEIMEAANAPLEHMFNNHCYCKEEWCNVLKAQADKKTYTHPNKFFSKETSKGKKMYGQLSSITKKYGSAFYIQQSMHTFDTQSNKALNQSQACLTPKNKSFHETRAFEYRHGIVVGTHNWGHLKYWTSVFDHLGVPYSTFFTDHLNNVDKKRKRWKDYHGKTNVKRRRAHKQDATEKRLIYKNRTTEYASGIGLDIGAAAAVAATAVEPNKKRAKRTQCRYGSTTHLTSRPKQCKYNKQNLLSMSLCAEMKEGEEVEGEDVDVTAGEKNEIFEQGTI